MARLSLLPLTVRERARSLLRVAAEASGARQLDISLQIVRADYMLDESPTTGMNIRQVEVNMISAAFGALSTRVSAMHRYLVGG